jgi:predicted dinucleotide-binding enzyme
VLTLPCISTCCCVGGNCILTRASAASAHVVKAFNTLFRDVLAAGAPLDVFMAGDDAQAKASVSAFITSRGLRPQV